MSSIESVSDEKKATKEVYVPPKLSVLDVNETQSGTPGLPEDGSGFQPS